MQSRIEPKRARYQWDSLHEMATWIANTPRTWRIECSRTNDYGRSWDLGASYVKAVEMARDGWIEGAQKVQDALKTLPLRTPEPDTRTDFYGFRPHVPRFCAGAPDSMVRHATNAESGSGKVLTLIVPLFISALQNAQNVANFGIAVAQYVNQLETDGKRVEVIGCFTQNNRGMRTSQAFTVKHADQPLDLAVLAFAIGHPAMFRRIGFALQERSAAQEDRAYGYPETPRLDDVINAPPGAIILDGMNRANEKARTPEAAYEYVSKQIERAIEKQEL